MVARISATFSAWLFSSLIRWATSRFPFTVRSALPSTAKELSVICWAEASTTSIVPRVSSMADTCWRLALSWLRAIPAKSRESCVSRAARSSIGRAIVPDTIQAARNPMSKIAALNTATVRVLVLIS